MLKTGSLYNSVRDDGGGYMGVNIPVLFRTTREICFSYGLHNEKKQGIPALPAPTTTSCHAMLSPTV